MVLILAILLGGLGVDRFYVGKIGSGILKLLTGGGFGICWLIDIILIAVGTHFNNKIVLYTTNAGTACLQYRHCHIVAIKQYYSTMLHPIFLNAAKALIR
ncbi:TM2 domain-containing protein [Acetanaerobacterium elongatum]|uniref:TM2 domain-containing protein n=1 Tax=Acetanaerobacterium elongatum TaxID=258515 RepID=UPI001FA73141|nr:TM2 domain-containing protein [Acetanaerobacterium elongatum]